MTDVEPYDPEVAPSLEQRVQQAERRAAKDCEMGVGTPDSASDSPTGRLAHREGPS